MASHVAAGRSVETSGRTVEQAVEAALARIGRSRDEVEVQVLREASKGVLGFGAHDAIVRVTELVTAPAPVAPAPVQTDEQPAEAFAEEDWPAEVEAAHEPQDDDFELHDDDEGQPYSRGTVTDEELLEVSREMLLEIITRMGVIADVLATWVDAADEREEPALILDIVGDDLGLLIGRRGETLRDLQYLLRLMVGRRIQGWANIVVDVEGYKQRRERNVRQLARRLAERVQETGRPAHMEPMNAYERRLVHLELRQMGGVSTKSSGEGERRKVGIYPEDYNGVK
ncbi:MAG TPA: RNA-binding cell elongation regulator Jag/EloR [Ardenticatenaceae bacterium]|jgi:spoIIIJ-associated protein